MYDVRLRRISRILGRSAKAAGVRREERIDESGREKETCLPCTETERRDLIPVVKFHPGRIQDHFAADRYTQMREIAKNAKPTSPASTSGDTVRSRCPCLPVSSYRRPHPRKPDSTSKSITVHSCARVRASECTSYRCTCTRCATVAFISNSFNWYSLQVK